MTREVRVPGGVFGAIPAAGIDAAQEVAGAMEEGRTLGRASSEAGEASGVARVFSQPLDVVDEVTGGRVSPFLLLAAFVGIAAALAFGLRREVRRW
ncbi:MAG: hypothetical protein H0U80_03120 [Solirubrobacterales bacterium]|nr:hypothetical protein [Solirubrobacterales bacterium]